MLPKDAEVHDSAGMDLGQIMAVIADADGRDIDVIRLHTGDPTIYGAIGEQMDELDRLGIAYEVIPGVSSFQAAAAAVCAELTAPEVSQTVILTRVAGRTPVPSGQELEKLAESRSTLCLFLSVSQIKTIADTLAETYGADCPARVVYRASWPDQKIIAGTLADIAGKVTAEGIDRTAMVIVGHALARPFAKASKLYDRSFTHGYRQGESK